MIRTRAALIALIGIATACGGETAQSGGPESPAGSGTTTSATDFTTRDIEGTTVRLSDHLGKDVVLLDFWQTYCEPCAAEFTHLQRIYEGKKSQGFVVMAISMDGPETVANVPAFAKRNGLSFPVLYDDDSHIANIYNPKKSAPLSVLIDRSGKVVRVREGFNSGDETLVEADVSKAVAGQPIQ